MMHIAGLKCEEELYKDKKLILFFNTCVYHLYRAVKDDDPIFLTTLSFYSDPAYEDYLKKYDCTNILELIEKMIENISVNIMVYKKDLKDLMEVLKRYLHPGRISLLSVDDLMTILTSLYFIFDDQEISKFRDVISTLNSIALMNRGDLYFHITPIGGYMICAYSVEKLKSHSVGSDAFFRWLSEVVTEEHYDRLRAIYPDYSVNRICNMISFHEEGCNFRIFPHRDLNALLALMHMIKSLGSPKFRDVVHSIIECIPIVNKESTFMLLFNGRSIQNKVGLNTVLARL